MSEASTDFVVDPDVHAVMEYMRQAIPPSRLVAVANGIAVLAPAVWGRYQPEEIQVLELVSRSIEGATSPCDLHTQSAASV